MKATQRRVIFELIKPSRTTAGGIELMTDMGREHRGRVVAIGPRCEEAIRVGDVIVPDWNAVVGMKHADLDLYVVDERGIHATLENYHD
jgi:co-chaperonin GroES (HSP10)